MTTPTDPSPPTLHGLTLAQLEAIRGYTTTLIAITSAYQSAKAIEPGGSLYSGRLARATLADAETASRGTDDYADGVRFALALPMVEARVAEIRAALASIRHDPGTDAPIGPPLRWGNWISLGETDPSAHGQTATIDEGVDS